MSNRHVEWFDAEMRRFDALTPEERWAEIRGAVHESVGDALKRALSGQLGAALRMALQGPYDEPWL